eukprot:7612902-Lingulodinium_polyedra.AAC.1
MRTVGAPQRNALSCSLHWHRPRASCFDVERAVATMTLASFGKEIGTHPVAHARLILRAREQRPFGRVD